ncbi:fumarylacetoacetate hydrolase family protein (plasmid) [Haloferacaceae archaeon DSL9]
MRLARYIAAESASWGVVEEHSIRPLGGLFSEKPTISEFADRAYRRRISRSLYDDTLPSIPRDAAKLLAPVAEPGQLICVGLNYHDHAEEQNEEIPDRPLLFTKSPSSVTNPGDPIIHPADVEQVDYEVELGIVIGRRARDVDADEAEEYVAGYTVVNDVSARDAQFADGQFFRGKSYESFAPMGPTMVTPDAIDPSELAVTCRVNGEPKQTSNTSQFIFDVGEVISYVSGIAELRPGDVISTGTPGGVGIFRDPPELLSPGDTVETEIEGIGSLRNPVVAESGYQPERGVQQ